MESTYSEIIEFITDAGKRLKEESGKVKDIGITKQYLTEEDLRIERGLTDIITKLGDDHSVFAEEENDNFQATSNVWVIDPISSTKNFIEGRPHYAIVVSHILDGQAQFAAVYDPSIDKLFTAYRGKGSFMNGVSVNIDNKVENKKVIFRISSQWRETDSLKELEDALANYELATNTDSVAIHYCDLLRGRVSGVICFAKDSFPNFAGSFLVNEAGGKATNREGSSNLNPTDRIFIAGSQSQYAKLFSIVTQFIK
ncbi:MAG TPA: inositol monophosphatase family protein [Patescibacteria group bacterium]